MSYEGMGRRDFLKSAGIVGAAAFGAAALGGCSPQKMSDTGEKSGASTEDISWDTEADVVVVGGGGTGFATAIAAGEAGATVIVLEKSGICGGSTALSGGMIMAADTDLQKEQGWNDDTTERFARQQIAYGSGLTNEDIVREMCEQSPDHVKFMVELGRTYNQLDILPPVWGFDEEDTWSARCHMDAQGQVGHFGCLQDKVKTMDNVEVRTNSEVTRIVRGSSGEVLGVEVGGKEYVKANKGVMIATASIDGNTEMARQLSRQQYWGNRMEEAGVAGMATLYCPSNTGDGLRMGMEIGAALDMGETCVMALTGYYGGVNGIGSYGTPPEGVEQLYPGTTYIGGDILVNAKGNRFVQEDAIWGYVATMACKENVKYGGTYDDSSIWGVIDANHVGRWIDSPAVPDPELQADTIEELAELMGVPPENLRDTVERWNEFSDKGVDSDFGRRADFGRIDTPPFYALKQAVMNMGTAGGLKINSDFQVLDVNGEVIPRLYAGGMAAGGWVPPFYSSCGWAVLGTVHHGRKAGANLAALDPIA